MIGGKKAAVQVSQRNADSRILKDGPPPLLAFPESLLGTSAVVDVYWQIVPAHDAAFFVPEGKAACVKPAVCPVGAPEAVLNFIGFARLSRPGQGGDRERKVIRVNRVAGPPVGEFLRSLVEILQYLAVEVFDFAGRRRRDNEPGNGIY